MKKIFKDYLILLISTIISIGIIVFDMNYYWPISLDWMEGNSWYAIIPFLLLGSLNIYFPFIDRKKRSILQVYKECTDSHEKKTFLKHSIGASSLIVLIIYFGVFYKYPEKKSITSSSSIKEHASTKESVSARPRAQAIVDDNIEEEPVEKPEVVEAPSFTEKEHSPFKPDIVIITKNFSDLPKNIVNHSFLSKVITKETMFYYEDDPQYLGLLGTIRRLSYEHNVDFKDNVLKYILSMPAEIALWKGSNGKIEKFLFVSDEESINKKILAFYLKLKQFSSDQKIQTFSYNGDIGYYLNISNQKLAIWNSNNKLYITNLHPKYFPDKNEEELKKIISKLFKNDTGKGFYKRLYNIATHNKHSIILSPDFLTFGYNYFTPSLKAIRLDFNNKKWGIQSLLEKSKQYEGASTAELWKAFPKSTAMCAGLPINTSRVSGIVQKYKELTIKRLEEENGEEEKSTVNEEVEENNKEELENKPIIAKKSIDIEKELITDQEIKDLVKSVVAACWYEQSTIYTPVFITKVVNATSKKNKIKFLFDKFIGGLEKRYDYREVIEETRDGITVLSRVISSKYGIKESGSTNLKGLRFKKFFNAKLAFSNDFIIFSPDGELVDLVISTLNKKNPSVHDELKIKDKNISYLLSPYGLSQLLNKYMKEALPSGQESVFRTAIESHLSSTFKNLSDLKPFGVDMPKPNEGNGLKWEKLGIYDL